MRRSTDRVHGARLDQNTIPRAGLDTVEEMLDLARADRGGKLVWAYSLIESRVDDAAGLGADSGCRRC